MTNEEYYISFHDQKIIDLWDLIPDDLQYYLSACELRVLWEAFSSDKYCAPFMFPSEELIPEFELWLNEDYPEIKLCNLSDLK